MVLRDYFASDVELLGKLLRRNFKHWLAVAAHCLVAGRIDHLAVRRTTVVMIWQCQDVVANLLFTSTAPARLLADI